MKPFILLCLMLLYIQAAQATHIFGGYIQAKPIAGSALSYEITAVIYMNEIQGQAAANQAADMLVCFGDGTKGTAYRQSRVFINAKTASINSYTILHTYTGSGTYALTVSPTNRTIVKNIPSADNLLFTISTTFNTITANQTPTPALPQNGFRVGAGQKAVISLKATDSEGDSLVYGLAKPLTTLNNDLCGHRLVTSYQFPNDLIRQGTFKLNNRTGDLVWDSPSEVGYYSVAITIDEYRNGNLISQTGQEIIILVDDISGTPSIMPPYEPAMEGAIITALTEYDDVNSRLTTFPNPVDDYLQVIVQTSVPTTAILQLLDINGRKLHESALNRIDRQHEKVISMTSMTPGIYILRVNTGAQTMVRKIVKR